MKRLHVQAGSEQSVLCADGDRLTLDQIHLYLGSGFIVRAVESAREALALATTMSPSLIVMGLKFPDMGGWDLLRQVKNREVTSHIPIIVFSESQDEVDKLLAMKLGASDYLKKPFSGKELVARIETILRSKSELDFPVVIANGPLTIDRNEQEAFLNGERLPLETTEFKLLCELMKNEGHPLTIYQLAERVWGFDYYDADTAARIHIKRIVKKLGEYGYMIEAISDDAFRIITYPNDQS